MILLHKATLDKIPIAKCANPECGCPILYINNLREKRNATVCMAEPNYSGPIFICPRCKKMLVVIEKPKITAGYVAVPIIQSV